MFQVYKYQYKNENGSVSFPLFENCPKKDGTFSEQRDLHCSQDSTGSSKKNAEIIKKYNLKNIKNIDMIRGTLLRNF
jgi:radical SAM superfamily enzyme